MIVVYFYRMYTVRAWLGTALAFVDSEDTPMRKVTTFSNSSALFQNNDFQGHVQLLAFPRLMSLAVKGNGKLWLEYLPQDHHKSC